PTSSMSAADLLAVLITRHLRYDWQNPRSAANDHLVFSKGHASPLLYAVFKAAGVVSDEELMTGYRRFGQRLEGHPTPGLPRGDGARGGGRGWGSRWPASTWTSWATGCGCSAATASWPRAPCGRRWTRRPITSCPTWSPSWTSTGSAKAAPPSWAGTWTPTPAELRHSAPACWSSTAMISPRSTARWRRPPRPRASNPRPSWPRPSRAGGFPEVEDKEGWHGRPFPPDMAERAIAGLGGVCNLVVRGPRPEAVPARESEPAGTAGGYRAPEYAVGEKVATRKAYGDALVALGAAGPKG